MVDIKILASGSSGNTIRIGDGKTALLLEAGIRFKDIQKGLNFQMMEIVGCLISHSHLDHSKAVREVVRAGIDIYASQGTIDALKLQGHRINVIKAKEQINIGTWTILPFDTIHDAPESLGFLLASGRDKILYCCDTCYIPYRFKGLTHVLIECNYSKKIINQNKQDGITPLELKKRVVTNHFALEDVKDFLRANDLSKVREIHLLHLSDTNSNAVLFKSEVQKLTGKPTYIAKKGVIYG